MRAAAARYWRADERNSVKEDYVDNALYYEGRRMLKSSEDDIDIKSGPNSIVDDGGDTDMTADIAKGLHMVAKRTKRRLNYKMESTEAQSTIKTSGTVGTEDQWNSGYRGTVEKWAWRTRGTVGREDQWNSGNRGPEEQWEQRTSGTVGGKDQRNSGHRGPMGTQDQRSGETRGTVGTEDQWAQRTRGELSLFWVLRFPSNLSVLLGEGNV
ncbi:hypothetical protein AWC38_SpisGene16690 [Stylophora pistillata]|uniref:Uncharacterized protein n=1 Tax=Stylophora pistillata TaxID=50429 RepID=A0A2B4RRG3_STYPI|nr:hypothetical protein AWC38_SpisGene16690 [Stylophora pistillata]